MRKTLKNALVVLSAILLVLSMVSCAFTSTVRKPANIVKGEYSGKTVILHSNDVHGAIEGYAYMAGLKTFYESKGANVIIVDAGDYSQGSTYVSISKGDNAITMMNAVGYDVVTIGNHEFDYGYAQLKENMKKFNGKVVVADVFEKGRTIFPATAVVKVDGLKIGFFGLETPEAQTKANPSLIKGLTFPAEEELFKLAQKTANRLSKRTDVVICLSHLGVDDESEGNRSIDAYPYLGKVDFVIDGHSHTVMEEGPNNEKIQSTGTKFENIGVIVIDNATKSIVENKLVSSADFAAYEDADVKALAKSIVDAVDEEFGAKFAESKVVLNGAKSGPGNRDAESNNGDLIADAMYWYVTKDGENTENALALTNGGGVRAYIYEGDVSMNDILTVLPFGNTVALVKVTGAELLEALEASTYCTPVAVGGFPQVAGIEFTIDTKVAFDEGGLYPGSTYHAPKSIKRVTITSVNGQPFDPNATYNVITNDFCAGGGDTYYAFKRAYDAGNTFDTGVTLDSCVVEYINEVLGGVIGEEYAAPQGRITIK